MKVPARGRVFRPGGITTMTDTMRYALSCPIHTTIVGCDTVSQLEDNVRIARDFQPLSADAMGRLERLTEEYAHDAAHFKRGGSGAETN